MGYSDGAAKEFVARGDVFADVCNYVVFHGRPVISAEDLQPWDPVKTVVDPPEESGSRGRASEYRRDLERLFVAMTDGQANYALLGVENQTEVDYSMPGRVLVYDALDYDRQIKRHRKEREGYSGHFWKDAQLMPCITIVLYLGKTPWDGPRDLRDMLALEGLPQELREIVNPYPMHLIDPMSMSEEEIGLFRSELQLVLLFIKYQRDKAEHLRIMEEYEGYRHMSVPAVRVMSAVTGLEVDWSEKSGKGEVDMCEAIQEIIADRCAEMENRCAEMENRCEEMEERCAETEERCAEMEERCAEMEERCAEMSGQLEEVRNESYEQGIERGCDSTRQGTIRQALALCLPLEQIAALVSLPVQEVQRIIDSLAAV